MTGGAVPTRRQFVLALASIGGQAAATAALGVMGLSATASAAAAAATGQPLALPADTGKGRRVAVVGAGIAGLVSAYELRRAGFEVRVFEARQRVGGRNWSLRNGDKVQLESGASQTVAWDSDAYFNAGPARLPSHHHTILGYTREFGVALETEVNASRSALVRGAGEGAQALPLRRLLHDARGHVSELLAKSTQQGALDRELSAEDRARLLDFLKVYGDLGPGNRYEGSLRSGFKSLPGAGAQGSAKLEPLPLAALLNPDLWIATVYDESIDQQPTMLQPVGGMDRIPYAFLSRLADAVQLDTELRGLRHDADGVSLLLSRGGVEERYRADYVVLALPAPVLAKVDADFSPDVARAIAAVRFDAANKIAWQSRRFWETEDGIYGGLSFIKAETSLVWYPSGGFQKPRGILVGNYSTGEPARALAAKPLAAQFEASRDAVNKLHPGRGAELSAPVSVSWHQVPRSLGPWARWSEAESPEYLLLNRPDGRVHFAGDWLAQVGAWQEGAALSAHQAARAIATATRA